MWNDTKGSRGSLLLKDLKILQCSQTSKPKSALKTSNGSNIIVKTVEKLGRWQQHFGQVVNTSRRYRDLLEYST